jgi:hypothetical protein
MTANVHDLLHLSDCCLKHGPLYEFSAFSYESLNSNFVSLAKGPTKHDIQIANNFCLYKYLYNTLVNDKISDDGTREYISNSLFGEKLKNDFIRKGTKIKKELNEDTINLLKSYNALLDLKKISFFKFVEFKNRRFSIQANNYDWCDYAISYSFENSLFFGLISDIIFMDSSIFCAVEVLQKSYKSVFTHSNFHLTSEFVCIFEKSRKIELISFDRIVDKFSLFLHKDFFIFLKFPNKIEYS